MPISSNQFAKKDILKAKYEILSEASYDDFSQNEKWKLKQDSSMMKNSNINDFENIVWIRQYEYKLLLHIKNTML